MSIVGAVITSVVGLFGLSLYQALVEQSAERRAARHKARAVRRRPTLRLIKGGKA